MTYVADTHALVWFLEANPQLSAAANAALLDPAAEVVIPTIVLAEITYLHARRRFTLDVPTVLGHITSLSNWFVYELNQQVVEHLSTALNIHDSIIVATAIVHRDVLGKNTAVVSRDAQITASGLIQIVW